MVRNDLDNIVLHPRELHVLMAQLRALGSFIDNSGIDLCWIESDVYGPATVKQIIDGNHVKRGLTAHTVTLQVLFTLYQKAFLSTLENHSVLRIKELARNLGRLRSLDITNKMEVFEQENNKDAEFQVFSCYLRMVMERMAFQRAVCTGDWKLHLALLEIFTKYFFAYDRLHYARMIPLYLAEMKMMEESDPEMHQEFVAGWDWVVNKNSDVSFCEHGADHALEQINRSIKVSGGLVGIMLNPNARNKFFLIAPELSRLADEAKEMAGANDDNNIHHHTLANSVIPCKKKNIEQLLTMMENFTNSFSLESDQLFSLVTIVMPNQVKDLMEQTNIGQDLFGVFAKD